MGKQRLPIKVRVYRSKMEAHNDGLQQMVAKFVHASQAGTLPQRWIISRLRRRRRADAQAAASRVRVTDR